MASGLEEESDAALIERCRAGSDAAWETLVRRYQRLIYAIPRRAGLDADAAADVFQNAFEQLHRALDRIAQPERIQAWLVTTARRESFRVVAARRRLQPLPDAPDAEPPALDPGVPAQIEALEEQHRVARALAGLEERCRVLLGLLYGEEPPPPYAAIAQRLGTREGSIGPWRARCLEKLRKALGP